MLTVRQAHHEGRPLKTLKIWQQNINKSQACQHDLISSGRLAREGIDIVALQEPAINHFGGTVTAREWTVLYPPMHGSNPTKTCSIILICTDILTDSWSQIDIHDGDISAILIRGSWGRIAIFNAYIDCMHDRGIEELARATRAYEDENNRAPGTPAHMLWIGDFNRHHPHWDRPTDNRLFTPDTLHSTEKLISAVAEAGLDLTLPPQIPTHKHNVTKKLSRLDQVFLYKHSMDTLISCDVLRHTPGICTDHLPILTALNMAVTHVPTKTIENFREVDWEKFRAELKRSLAQLGLPEPIRNQASLNSACTRLTMVLQGTITTHVPTSEICPKSKRWWTKELMAMRRNMNKLGRKVSKLRSRPGDPLRKEYKTAKKVYAREIKKNNKQHWRDWLERAQDPDIWMAHRYISATSAEGNNSRIPTLNVKVGEMEKVASTNVEKSKLLAETFFPKSPETVASRAEQEEEAVEPVCTMDKLTKEQISRHLSKLKPFKAPGPDGIPNIILSKCADLLLDRLFYIYKAMIEHGLFYEPWKKFTTVVLRKPGKPKYSIPKA